MCLMYAARNYHCTIHINSSGWVSYERQGSTRVRYPSNLCIHDVGWVTVGSLQLARKSAGHSDGCSNQEDVSRWAVFNSERNIYYVFFWVHTCMKKTNKTC